MVQATDFVFDGNMCSITIPEDLGIAGVAMFRDVCKHLPESVEIFEIDMMSITEISVSSLSMLFVLTQEGPESVHIRLINCSASVSALLHNHGFHQLLSVNRRKPESLC